MYRKIYTLNNNEIIAIEEDKHQNENDFQELIAKYPEIIPGEQISPEDPRKWILVGREIDNIDVLLLDQDGVPTIVEIKKGNNAEIYREVSSQMLDYGSNLFKLSIDRIINNINRNALDDFLDGDEEEFMRKILSNLENENMRLLVVSDHIPDKLQNLVEFINNKISIEVLAVEIKQYKDVETGIKTFVPKVFGHSRSMAIYEPELNERSFFDNLDEVGTDFYRKLLDFASSNGFNIKWTRNGFFLTVPVDDYNIKILHCYSKLYAFGQSIFSTHSNITTRVIKGDVIFQKYLGDILEIEDVYAVSDGFGYKIEGNFSEDEWETFIRILLEVKENIKVNGVIKELN